MNPRVKINISFQCIAKEEEDDLACDWWINNLSLRLQQLYYVDSCGTWVVVIEDVPFCSYTVRVNVFLTGWMAVSDDSLSGDLM